MNGSEYRSAVVTVTMVRHRDSTSSQIELIEPPANAIRRAPPSALAFYSPPQTVFDSQYPSQRTQYKNIPQEHPPSIAETLVKVRIGGIHRRKFTVINRFMQSYIRIVLRILSSHGRNICSGRDLQIYIAFILHLNFQFSPLTFHFSLFNFQKPCPYSSCGFAVLIVPVADKKCRFGIGMQHLEHFACTRLGGFERPQLRRRY